MKGNAKLIEVLNLLLADELTAISQYMVHSEMSANWGYEALHEHFEKRARDEMKHAEMLIARIIFLEGMPIVSKLNKISVGSEVPKQLQNDLAAEMGAVKGYNEAIQLALEVGDSATRVMLDSILKDEDDHVDKIEERLDQIQQIGIQLFLAQQIKD
jgi:bacterioferritin